MAEWNGNYINLSTAACTVICHIATHNIGCNHSSREHAPAKQEHHQPATTTLTGESSMEAIRMSQIRAPSPS